VIAAEATVDELNLLLDGDQAAEDERNYDMREIVRAEKFKTKGAKLRGKRKRKEEVMCHNVNDLTFDVEISERYELMLYIC
jgi:hypothetical protein